MRVEDIEEGKLLGLSNSSLKELRLRCRQLFRKYEGIEKKEPLIHINKGTLEEKYRLLMAEFDKRGIPYQKWEIDKGDPGIYLVPPHGEWLWEGEKTLIVKAKAFKGMVGKPLILVSADKAYGIIKLKVPKRITLEEFRKLECEHRISEEEQAEWWPRVKTFYAYQFILEKKYETPKDVKIPQGIQTFIQNVEFEKKMIWQLAKPDYRIFEPEDLKNTPGFKEGKVVVEAKFDGVRCISALSPILTSNKGLAAAQNIKPGDRVITENGIARVRAVARRKLASEENLIEIKPFLGMPFKVSSDHLCMTEEGWKEAGELTTNDYLFVPFIEPKEGEESRKELILTAYESYKKKISLDADFMRFLGKWVGDGYSGNGKTSGRVGLAFNYATEENNIEFYKDVIGAKIGVTVRQDRNCQSIFFHDPPLWHWLAENFRQDWPSGGRGYRQKTIPDWFDRLSNTLWQAFIEGLWEADGHDNILTNSSKSLISRLYLQFLKRKSPLGIKRRWAKYQGGAKTTYKLLLPQREDYRMKSTEQGFFLRVQSIKIEPYYYGDLYDFEVEGDSPTFLSSCLLHNCRMEKRNGKAIIFTDPEETSTPDKSGRLPPQIAELEKMYADNFTLDAELVMLNENGDEVLHRTMVNALINSKFDPTEKSKRARIYAFDVLELDGNSTRTWPLKERKEALEKFKDTEHVKFVRATTDLDKPALSYVVPVSAVERAIELVMKTKPKFVSEGAMIKLLDAPYSGKAMVKWKQKFEIDCLVVGRNEIVREGKKTDNFNFLLAVGPLPAEWASAIERTDEKAVVEYGGKKYNYIGKSDNTKQKVAIGGILRVAAEDVNRFETGDPEKPYFKAYVSVVMQPVPEKKSPDAMQVLERLSEMTARREQMKKGLFTEIELRGKANINDAVKASVEAGKIPRPIYQEYAEESEPLPKEFYTDYQEGIAWAQTHIRGLEPDEVKKYEAKQLSLAELMKGHSVHVDLRMNLGKEKLIQWVILDNDIPSYLRYLTGELRETAGGKNVQHSMAVVKPSAEEPQKLEKTEEIQTISTEGAKALEEIQITGGSYLIIPGGIGATTNTYSWMGLIWKGKMKAGIQRKDYHEYFLYPEPDLPERNQRFFDGRFVFKCLKREKGGARWETWKAASDPLPQDPIEHKDGGYYYPVKAEEVKSFGQENYSYGKKEPIRK